MEGCSSHKKEPRQLLNNLSYEAVGLAIRARTGLFVWINLLVYIGEVYSRSLQPLPSVYILHTAA